MNKKLNMKRILILLIVLIGLTIESFAQCKIQTTHRPDNNTIKYFNPTPVIRQSNYEVGIALYKNIISNELSLNIFVLFKEMSPKDLTGDAVLQTTNVEGIRLKPILSKMIQMNGRDVAIGQYKIDQRTFEELKNYNLKSIFFYVNSELIGSTVTENRSVLKKQIRCFIDDRVITIESKKQVTDSINNSNLYNSKFKENLNSLLQHNSNRYDLRYDVVDYGQDITDTSSKGSDYDWYNSFDKDNDRTPLFLLIVLALIVVIVIIFVIKLLLKPEQSENEKDHNKLNKGENNPFSKKFKRHDKM